MIGRMPEELFDPVTVERWAAQNREVLATGRPLDVEDGWGERTHLTQKTPVFDADGRAVAVIGLSTDITEQKLAERALRRSETRLTDAQQIAGVGSWHWDPDAHEVTWSAELRRMLGLEPGTRAARRRHARARAPATTASGSPRRRRPRWRTGGTMELELRMRHADGDYRLLLCRGGATMGPGGSVRRFDGVCEDVTERRRRRAAAGRGAAARADRLVRSRPRAAGGDVVAGDLPHLRSRLRAPRPVARGRARHGPRAGPRAAAGRGRPRDRRGRRVRLLRDDPPRGRRAARPAHPRRRAPGRRRAAAPDRHLPGPHRLPRRRAGAHRGGRALPHRVRARAGRDRAHRPRRALRARQRGARGVPRPRSRGAGGDARRGRHPPGGRTGERGDHAAAGRRRARRVEHGEALPAPGRRGPLGRAARADAPRRRRAPHAPPRARSATSPSSGSPSAAARPPTACSA